jgi:hypothetical protein
MNRRLLRKGSLVLSLLLSASPLWAKKFYSDDPLLREPRPLPVDDVTVLRLSQYYDFFHHTFATPGELNTEKRKKHQPVVRAQAVNTLGEPMDGAWYTHRHYWKPMSIEELVRGPGGSTPPSSDGRWTIVSAKTQGITPGFTMVDSANRKYFVKFDPANYPELATAAETIVSRILYALGYHVDDNYLIYFDRNKLILGEDVQITDRRGRKRRMTERDLNEILIKSAETQDGRYRAIASLQLPGKDVGRFRFYGTRSDDPNDTVPHEHRRELRGYYVFCAWLNHDDSRAINTLDTLVEEDGIKYIRHHPQDFGSTLGSGTERPKSPRAGGDYLFEWDPTLKHVFSLGLSVPYWAHAKYPKYPSVGTFESQVFRPDAWYPEYPNPAFLNRLPDDDFWAAKQVMAFTDEQIRAIAKTGQYSDPDAEKYVADCLIARRNKIGQAFFAKVLPLDLFAVEEGRLAFIDVAKKQGMDAAHPLAVAWSHFDNETENKTPLLGENSFAIPNDALGGNGTKFYAADISRNGDAKQTITVYLRCRDGQAEVVGVERSW